MHGRAWVMAMIVGASACSRAPSNDAFATVTADELRAKVRGLGAQAVLVNAWATWCDSCQHELPMLQQFSDQWAARGVRVLLVSVDEPEDREKAKAFLAESAIRLPSCLAARPLGPFKSGMNPRWPGMLPASFLFDSTGKLRYFWGGEAYEKEIVPIVEGLLAGKPIDGETRFDLAPGQTTDPPSAVSH
jgi:thiol-disulfide isomerase/thioredoxin